ncbi:hypothetical protein ACOSP7_023656 [Xanthoceras sorbifolium]
MDKDYNVLYLYLGECLSSFNLEKAVCNHGFFMMSPNKWNSSTKSLERPLRLEDSVTSLHVSISHPINKDYLLIRVYGTQTTLSLPDQQTIKDKVARMLRITEKDERDIKEFQKLHGEAKDKGFGRLFRSPCLFEDVIKCILLCNISWKQTLYMTQALCELQAELSTSNLAKNNVRNKCGNFPSARELANMSQKNLKILCNVGYRAKYIQQFAKKVESGKINLKEFEQGMSYDQVYEELRKNKGFGDFTCANVLMCIGFYQKIPTDSETLKLLRKVHSRESTTDIVEGVAKQVYDKYAPFQCLAYWLELVNCYENKVGRLCELDRSKYDDVTLSENDEISMINRKRKF